MKPAHVLDRILLNCMAIFAFCRFQISQQLLELSPVQLPPFDKRLGHTFKQIFIFADGLLSKMVCGAQPRLNAGCQVAILYSILEGSGFANFSSAVWRCWIAIGRLVYADLEENFTENAVPLGLLTGEFADYQEFLKLRRQSIAKTLKAYYTSL